MNKKMTIEELADAANELLSSNASQSSDARITSKISVRRIRDYVAKDILDKPFKEGRNTYYTQQHLEKLLTVRELQSDGLSDQYLQKLSSSTYSSVISENTDSNKTEDDILRERAQAALNGMNVSQSVAQAASVSSNMFIGGSQEPFIGGGIIKRNSLHLESGSLLDKSSSIFEQQRKDNDSKYTLPSKIFTTSKTWVEYPLDSEGKTFLKMESGEMPKDPQQILERIKTILNIN